MNRTPLFAVILALLLAAGSFAQRPPQAGGGPPQGGQPGIPGQGPGGPGRGPGPRNEWNRMVDTNKDGNVDASEFQAAIDRTFTALDRNNNGVIDADEGRMAPPPPNAGQSPRPNGINDKVEGMDLLPPFFFDRALKDGTSLTREQFAAAAKAVFNEMDKDHDGVLSKDEARPPRGPDPPRDGRGGGEPGAPPPPNAQFVGAELRFGDKVVPGQPFSAEMQIKDTKMLMDGTLVTKEMSGLIYRDKLGRTRREQPLGDVAGVNILGSDKKPQQLVFINDPVAGVQYFLDPNNSTARTTPLEPGRTAPLPDEGSANGKVIDDGTRTIEGISCKATRVEHEIPAGAIGNTKPLQVVDERCYSPDLQLVIQAMHQDPVQGIHLFQLVNIKRAEPSADLFTVPLGYRVENGGDRRRP
jgi:hypothetical protein